MAELEERFSQLLADPERMQKVVDMARAILSQRESAPSVPSSPAPAAAAGDPPASAADSAGLSAMLSAMLKAGEAAPEAAAPPATGGAMEQSPLATLLPQLMTLLSGQGDLVKSERLDLLRAMKPYLKENRISSIDRAVRMANMTKAAASAMHLLGR